MRRQRSGTVIVVVLVGLLVVSALAIQLTRSTLLRQRQLRANQNQLQSLWIAESAAGRAASRLRSDPQYSGEIWRIPADQITGDQSAVAEIKVSPLDDSTATRRILVEAFYPDDRVHRVATQKTIVIQIRKEGDAR